LHLVSLYKLPLSLTINAIRIGQEKGQIKAFSNGTAISDKFISLEENHTPTTADLKDFICRNGYPSVVPFSIRAHRRFLACAPIPYMIFLLSKDPWAHDQKAEIEMMETITPSEYHNIHSYHRIVVSNKLSLTSQNTWERFSSLINILLTSGKVLLAQAFESNDNEVILISYGFFHVDFATFVGASGFIFPGAVIFEQVSCLLHN